MLKAIHAQEDRQAARQKVEEMAQKLGLQRLGKAGELVRTGVEETSSFYEFPANH